MVNIPQHYSGKSIIVRKKWNNNNKNNIDFRWSEFLLVAVFCFGVVMKLNWVIPHQLRMVKHKFPVFKSSVEANKKDYDAG